MIKTEKTKKEMKKLAVTLAREHKKYEPSISRVLWFPDDEELRIVDVDKNCIASDVVVAYHFGPNEAIGVPKPTAIAIVRPGEVKKKIPLPDGWGDWKDAEEMDINGKNSG